ncbi:GrpB family protein [Oribacterium sinus]|uniref:GrpB family protein n=1 Tax=Oribacterium sinus TaxID=237576 RepID=A0A930GZ22_9FIRM|nr:GrpB family protein [Oribacterium sinus]MBF1273466.1 GrpB family protein [Oribacterium sinus]
MRTEHIVIKDYTPEWKTEFQKIVASLGNEILAKSLSIEHVGSTSVENLAAKPIIDMDIVIPDMSVFPEMKSLLEKKGYRHEGNLGIEGREAFSYEEKPELMVHHLYVCPSDSKELKRHIAFRDYLRTHPHLAEEYAEVKREAARLYPKDIDKYLEYKGKFIESVYLLYETIGLEGK